MANRASWYRQLMAAAACSTLLGVAAQAATFAALGDLPGNRPRRSWSPQDVSADGRVVVGWPLSGADSPFRWTPESGAQPIGGLARPAASRATGVSDDGNVIVGYETDTPRAFLWTAASGAVYLPALAPDGVGAKAWGVSADGRTVVGSVDNQPAAWIDGQLQMLALPPTGFTIGAAWETSDDGRVIVGGGFNGVRWVDGVAELLDPVGEALTSATGVSADGSVVVGELTHTGRQGFVWTAATGLQVLAGAGPGVAEVGRGPAGGAKAVSADGRIAVGSAAFLIAPGQVQEEAAIWIDGGSPLRLVDVLTAQGVEGIDEWFLFAALGVSADGRTIVGEGSVCNSEGCAVPGWIATIDPTAVPAPPAFWLLATASSLLLIRRRGWR